MTHGLSRSKALWTVAYGGCGCTACISSPEPLFFVCLNEDLLHPFQNPPSGRDSTSFTFFSATLPLCPLCLCPSIATIYTKPTAALMPAAFLLFGCGLNCWVNITAIRIRTPNICILKLCYLHFNGNMLVEQTLPKHPPKNILAIIQTYCR